MVCQLRALLNYFIPCHRNTDNINTYISVNVMFVIDCLTSSLVPVKPWDDSSLVIRPSVEVEEFCQSCPEAAHPHTSYVNNLYVYPLALNYSNQKVFSKVNQSRLVDHTVPMFSVSFHWL